MLNNYIRMLLHGNIAKGGGNMKTMKQVDIGLAMRAMIEMCRNCRDYRKCPIIGVCVHGCPLEWDTSKMPEIGEHFVTLKTVD